jgi:hypothetical protein
MSVTLLWKDLLVGLATENDKGKERNYFFVFEPIEKIHYYITLLLNFVCLLKVLVENFGFVCVDY